MKIILEKILQEISYEEINDWHINNLTFFSNNKKLFCYQEEALKNLIKLLYLYFSSFDENISDEKLKAKKAKRKLFKKYKEQGLDEDSFSIRYPSKKQKKEERKSEESRFRLFSNYFDVEGNELEQVIYGYNFINRAAFWMATGSGKSIVLIKAIEILDFLQSQGFIPKREIMLLLPREDLIKQFKKEVEEFNAGRDKKIELISLKDYEDDKERFDFGNAIKVYYYRSDLLRNERTEKYLDYKSYENNGNWYVFLDEAHRGKEDVSLMQDYVKILSRNGFLFNFSATFTDEIDRVTTCYNFNLEKFITEGYGKNIYLSQSYFDFQNNRDDLSEDEKIEQVLKSLVTFTLVKKSRTNKDSYHAPLMMTLVNSVNTEVSDLLLFFKTLERVATGKFDENIFIEIKDKLLNEFKNNTYYVFGEEKFEFDYNLLEKMTINELLMGVFNSASFGKFEILEGEKGKELVLKLETTDKPFALIKIGDTSKFKKEHLDFQYNLLDSFDTKKYFENINENGDINLLIGSRSFYEGWDSNRPNIINMINIGKGDAKKFVLQGIGRGIRIEPKKGLRKRLDYDDEDKNILLETLFIFATDKESVKAILKEIEIQKTSAEEFAIGKMFEVNKDVSFDLLIPKFKDDKERKEKAKFNISEESKERFFAYLKNISPSVLLLKYGLKRQDVNEILSDEFYQIKDNNKYSDMKVLLQKIVVHKKVHSKVVDKIDLLKDEIIHFKHIKIRNLTDKEIENLQQKISQVKNFEELSENDIDKLFDEGKISREEYKKKIKQLGTSKPEKRFKDLKIKKIVQHYYLPLIYSENEKQDYIKHIINVPSEVRFIKNLEEFIKNNNVRVEWMFSKIDESLDKVFIPYFYRQSNIYRKFYPDFIFWIKKGRDYKIVFVDPKGTSNADYQNKVDEFEKLFLNKNSSKKVFEYKGFKISFDLKLIAEGINTVSEKYRAYWLASKDFSFLSI